MIASNSVSCIEEQFTKRLLRRANTKVRNPLSSNLNNLKWRLNILQAINGNLSIENHSSHENISKSYFSSCNDNINRITSVSFKKIDNSNENFYHPIAKVKSQLKINKAISMYTDDYEDRYSEINDYPIIEPQFATVKYEDFEASRKRNLEFNGMSKTNELTNAEDIVDSDLRTHDERTNLLIHKSISDVNEITSWKNMNQEKLSEQDDDIDQIDTCYKYLTETLKNLEHELQCIEMKQNVRNSRIRDTDVPMKIGKLNNISENSNDISIQGNANYFVSKHEEQQGKNGLDIFRQGSLENGVMFKDNHKRFVSGQFLSSNDKNKDTPEIDALQNIRNYLKNEKLINIGETPVKTQNQQTMINGSTKNTRVAIPKPRRIGKIPNLESTRNPINIDSTKRVSPFMDTTISSIVASDTKENINDGKFSHMNLDTTNNIMSFDVNQFFENAFSHDFLSSSLISEKKLFYYDNLNEEINEVKTPCCNKIQTLRSATSEPPAYSNTSLKRTMTFYRSFTDSSIEKFQPEIKRFDQVQNLLQELEIHQTRIYQISKALHLCNTVRRFKCSIQHIESERLLLLSSLKSTALLGEIKRIHNNTNKRYSKFSERGVANISNIRLYLKEDIPFQNKRLENSLEWFVVIVSQGSTVWATDAINYSNKNTKIYFPGSISIPNLTPDFKIIVSIYTLQLKKNNVDQDETSSTNDVSVICPSPKKIWKKIERAHSLRQYQIQQCPSTKDTSFKFSGYVELKLPDLSSTPPWPLCSVPVTTALHGIIDLNLSCKLDITVSHAGFLTHGNECGGYTVWNRRWCVLEGNILKFWNYPQDREFTASLFEIDLMCCISKEVTVADRQTCAKPRTLMFKTTRERMTQDQDSILVECNPTFTIVTNLLACDTIEDFLEWSKKLNHVVAVLQEWKNIDDSQIILSEI